MLRTIFLLGICVLLGIFALQLVFGVLGGLVRLVIFFAWQALVICLLGFALYVVIRILSPETARKIRSKFGGMS